MTVPHAWVCTYSCSQHMKPTGLYFHLYSILRSLVIYRRYVIYLIDIDECASSEDNNCDDDRGNCTNTEGSFECFCRVGFSGDGTEGNCTGSYILTQSILNMYISGGAPMSMRAQSGRGSSSHFARSAAMSIIANSMSYFVTKLSLSLLLHLNEMWSCIQSDRILYIYLP